MKIAIVHISDIHFRGESRPNSVLGRRSAIVRAVATYLSEDDAAIYLIVSGDIVFSGTAEQYGMAGEFLLKLRDDLQAELKRAVVVLVVPGNHDLDHQLDTPGARNIVVENLDPDQADKSIVEICTKPQERFKEFADRFAPGRVRSKLGLVDEIQFRFGSKSLVVRLINSAWMSMKTELQGRLKFPVKELERNEATDRAELSISVLHHPLNWFESNNARRLLAAIEESSDVVLTGHEHDPSTTTRERPGGAATEWIEGGALQEDNPHNSSFNLLVINSDAGNFEVWNFDWSKSSGVYLPRESRPPVCLFRRNVGRLKDAYSLNPEFQSQLSESLEYAHPTGARPRLDDLFVYPDLKELPLFGAKPQSSPIVDPLAYILRKKQVIITGCSQCGKTSLCRMLFRDLREHGLVPILLSGQSLRAASKDKLQQSIRREFVAQYNGTNPEIYLQAPKEGKVVIVDDWHVCNLNRQARSAVLKALTEWYSVVVLLADDQVGFEEFSLLRDGNLTAAFDFGWCEILPLGHRKRDELVERWYSLGRTHNDDEVVLAQRAIRAAHAVSSALGRGLPCYPPWLLIWLQGIDANSSDPRHVGSQGYLYQALITLSLQNASRGRIQDDVLLNYLSELASEIYSSEAPLMAKARYLQWHYKFNDRYALSIDLEKIQSVIEKAGIIVRLSDGSVRFKFRGLLYFFVARYLAERISDEEVRRKIEGMAESVQREDSCGILNSLAFLTKDSFVVDTLISSAKKIFAAVDDCNILVDTKFLRVLEEEVPKLVVERLDARANRRELLAIRDEVEHAVDTVDLEAERLPDDPIFAIIRSIKMIGVLGQVLRSFSGSILAARKIEIAEECFSLGLRTLKFLLQGLKDDQQGLAELVVEVMRREQSQLDREAISTQSRTIVSNLAYGLGLNMARHVSSAVGHESLSRVFEMLLARKNGPSYRLISFSIELDHYPAFPFGTLSELKVEFKKSSYAMYLLRALVWHHVYVFPMSPQQLARVCAAAALPINEMKMIRHMRGLPAGS